MTREEAIGHIKDVICENNTIKPNMVVFEQEKEALCMAIEALKAQPCKDDMLKIEGMCENAYEQGYQQARFDYEVQPCDAVSRADVILIVQDIDMKSDVYEALKLIKALPSVQPTTQPCDNCEKVREAYTNGFDYGVKEMLTILSLTRLKKS